MNDDLEKRIREALANPRNMGELADADAIGTVGNSECGEMLRMWIKYKQVRGRRVIDQGENRQRGFVTQDRAACGRIGPSAAHEDSLRGTGARRPAFGPRNPGRNPGSGCIRSE